METHEFEAQIQNHLENLPTQLSTGLRHQFQREQAVKLEHLVPKSIANELQREAHELLATHGKRREMVLAATGGTPRSYTSVARDHIYSYNGVVRKIFECDALRNYLSMVAGEPLFRVPYEPEEYIINSQNQSGDTHGWHFDDYTYALIWIVDAPGPFDGGRVEFVNFTEWDKAAPREQLISLLSERTVQSMHVPAGTCYLMKARYVLHRVSPILNNAKRSVIVYTFATAADLQDHTISHETMEQIYDLPDATQSPEHV
jgi:hypothetical protein